MVPDRQERNSNRVRRQSLRQAPRFLDRGPRPVVRSCRGGLQKHPNHTVNNQIRPHRTETSPEDYGLGTRPDHGFCCLLRTDEGEPRPKYIFNKCGTNIYFFTLQRFGPSPSLNFKHNTSHNIKYKLEIWNHIHHLLKQNKCQNKWLCLMS